MLPNSILSFILTTFVSTSKPENSQHFIVKPDTPRELMNIKDTFKACHTSISFEFFPPQSDDGLDDLLATIDTLTVLNPGHISVTYGAGGTTQDHTLKTIKRIMAEQDLPIVSHLTCVGASEEVTRNVIQDLATAGVTNILALRGDPPLNNPDWQPSGDHFQQAADLIHFISREFPEMGIGVAGFPEGHPHTPNRMQEMDFLKAKVDAGADYIVTQLFFDNRDFYDFRERCQAAGIDIPIVAGILPVTSGKMLHRLSELSGGSRIPAAFSRWLERLDNEESTARFGAHWAAEQVRDLIDQDTAGIHLYTLNHAASCLRIFKALGLHG